MASQLPPLTRGLPQTLRFFISLLGPSDFLFLYSSWEITLSLSLNHQPYVVDSPFSLQTYTSYREKLRNLGVRQGWGEIPALLQTTYEIS